MAASHIIFGELCSPQSMWLQKTYLWDSIYGSFLQAIWLVDSVTEAIYIILRFRRMMCFFQSRNGPRFEEKRCYTSGERNKWHSYTNKQRKKNNYRHTQPLILNTVLIWPEASADKQRTSFILQHDKHPKSVTSQYKSPLLICELLFISITMSCLLHLLRLLQT